MDIRPPCRIPKRHKEKKILIHFSNFLILASKAPTEIPLFIIFKKGIALNVPHPKLLYGFAGSNIRIIPKLSVGRLVMSRHLWVLFVVVNISDDNEYGQELGNFESIVLKEGGWFGTNERKEYRSFHRLSVLK